MNLLSARLIIVFSLWLANCIAEPVVDTALCQLSEEDKKYLNAIFHILVDSDQFAYTLFGDKPVSLSGHYLVLPYDTGLRGIIFRRDFWRAWSIWKRVQTKLPISNYIFIEEAAYNFTENGMKFIFFINKDSFVRVVDQNIEIFNSVLGHRTNGQQLLAQMEAANAFMPIILNDQTLLGILLGYGKHNAQLYARRDNLRRNKLSGALPRIVLSRGFSTLKDEEEFLNQQLQPAASYDFDAQTIAPVQFAADLTHQETKHLQKKYSQMRQKICSMMVDNEKFLALILTQMTRKNS